MIDWQSNEIKMNNQISDTHPEADNFQISLFRKASIAERVSRVRTLSSAVINLSRRAIKRANPNLSEDELNYIFIANHYGKDLADRLREYLIRKKQ